MKILKINNLNYDSFNDLSVNFEKGKISFIIGDNNSGKTLLFNIISSKILINDTISLDDHILDGYNRNNYLKRIGVVTKVNENSFCFASVLDELMYPLFNLGYHQSKINYIIKKYLALFEISSIIDKKINDLTIYEKQKLLLVISLLHEPSVLLLDNCLDFFPLMESVKIMNILKSLCSDYLTVLYFTSNLNLAMFSDKIILLSNYKIIGEYTYHDIYNNDKVFYDHNIEIPFIYDLSIKLKMYNLIESDFDSLEMLVDNLWD